MFLASKEVRVRTISYPVASTEVASAVERSTYISSPRVNDLISCENTLAQDCDASWWCIWSKRIGHIGQGIEEGALANEP